MTKSLTEFYSKGNRLEARCKICLKAIRRAKYAQKRPRRARNVIDKVIVKYVVPENLEQFRREMETIETIFENLIYKVMSKRIEPQEK